MKNDTLRYENIVDDNMQDVSYGEEASTDDDDFEEENAIDSYLAE